MKKTVSIIISSLMAVSLVTAAYASNDVKGKSSNAKDSKNKIAIQTEINQEDNEIKMSQNIDELRMKLKENKKNKEERKQLIRQIVNLKRMKNDKSIPVFVKGIDVKFDVPPVIKYGRTLIPVRAVVNALGAEVDWDMETKTVTVTRVVSGDAETEKTVTILIKLGSNIAIVDGQEVKIDVSVELISNRTFVPIRFIAETFNMNVDWDNESGSVIIDDQNDESDAQDAEETESTDETAEQPADQTDDQTTEQGTEQTGDQTVEQGTEQTGDQTVEQGTEQTDDQTTEQSTEQTDDQTVESESSQTTEQPTDEQTESTQAQ